MGVVSITYNEGNHRSYKKMGYESVNLSYGKNTHKKFNTGNFEQDWYDMRAHMIKKVKNEPYFCHSSSVDHFIMDGAPFESAYLHPVAGTNNEEWELIYWDKNKHNLYADRHIYENGWKFFVKKGTRPTWAELKAKYMKINSNEK
jgi:hypothetical protein